MRHTRAQKRAELMTAAAAAIEEFLDWEETAAEPTLTEMEEVVLKLRPILSRRMLEVALKDQDTTQLTEEPNCPSCGQAMRYKGQKGVAVESRLGGLSVERGHYYCAHCESGLFPPGPAT